ncbi:uncharacterized protein LOC119510385 isoform X3 [Choloepus didactylus]|uniref:uncharacterized protein LOC119510385 isoform X3 n=1 Tax=Choloepus didactylus TaxID=27675 RepID=UPI00189DBD66|nr:uncharacterized protein LOC119510385 isoform X3 [Choloepus didactylus]
MKTKYSDVIKTRPLEQRRGGASRTPLIPGCGAEPAGPRAEGETEASRMQGSCTGLSHSVWKCHRGVWIAPRVTLSRAFCLETALQMGAAGSMETPEGALVGNQGEERARGGFPRNRRDPEQQTSFWSQCCTVWPPPHPCSGFRGRLGMRSKYPT